MSASPDGRRLAFTAKDASGKILLWVRSFDTLTSQALAGTDGAFLPFWSPDSRSIGFFAQGKLKRVDLAGGPPRTLANAPAGRGGTWNRDNVIIFAPAGNDGLFRVGSDGGEPVPLTKLAEGQSSHRAPSFLPDGCHFLYAATERSAQISEIFVGALGSDESKRLLSANTGAVYAVGGYLLFARQGTFLRQPFDTNELELTGDPVLIAESVSSFAGIGAFSVSNNGGLAYRTGGGTEDVKLSWVDRSGKLIETVGNAFFESCGFKMRKGIDFGPRSLITEDEIRKAIEPFVDGAALRGRSSSPDAQMVHILASIAWNGKSVRGVLGSTYPG